MQTEDYRLVLFMRAVTQITQMKERYGNKLLINRVQRFYRGEAVSTPAVSANCLRRSAVRQPGGMWLIDAYGLSGELSKDVLRLLASGGNNATKQSSGSHSLAHYVAMRQYLPLLGLMGGGLPESPQFGVTKFGDGVVVCDEQREYLGVVLDGIAELPAWLRPGETCVSSWTIHRHDVTKPLAHMLADQYEREKDGDEREQDGDGDAKEKGSGMIVSGEAIMPGSVMVSEIRLTGASVVELGALVWSLRLWQQAGGHVGGMSARGNGKLEAMLYCEGDIDLDAVAEDYVAYAMSVRAEAVDWLNTTYARDSGKKPRGKKKAEAAT